MSLGKQATAAAYAVECGTVRQDKNIPVLEKAGCHFRLIVVGLGRPIGRARARAQQFADRGVR